MIYKLEELFLIKRGNSIYSKSYGESNKGIYPVYSGSINNPLMYIDSWDYSQPLLTWSIDGYSGRLKILEGNYSITDRRGILIPREELYSKIGGGTKL